MHTHSPSASCNTSRHDALAEALRFLDLAAANGNAEAQRKLADALWFGDGGARDLELALAHYDAAAAR